MAERIHDIAHYSQGCAADGPAILRDGVPLTPEEIVEELSALQARNERLRAGLRKIIAAWDDDDDSMGSDPAEIARAALAAEGAGSKEE